MLLKSLPALEGKQSRPPPGGSPLPLGGEARGGGGIRSGRE